MAKQDKVRKTPQIKPPVFSANVDFKPKKNKGYQNRVLLLNPPTDRTQFVGSDNYFPLGLIMLATVLRGNDDVAEIMDINNDFFHRDLNDHLFIQYMNEVVLPYVEEFKPELSIS